MNFNDAKQIAESWVGVISGNQAVIDREKTLALPYGWVFFYQHVITRQCPNPD
jgi:hypothetical protein